MGVKLNQKEIAEKTGISQPQISRIYNGKPISKKTAEILSKFIDRKWNNIMVMEPEKIKELLEKSLSKL